MLYEFLTANRPEIIARARARVKERTAPRPTDDELEKGIPLFLDQLVTILRQSTSPGLASPELADAAARHGGELRAKGFSVSQVVSDYGDVCQVVTELAHETGAPITVEEYQTFNLCLDNATAQAVSEYGRVRERGRSEDEARRLGELSHELRNRLNTAMLGFSAIRSGSSPVGGSVANVVWQSLESIRDLVSRSLTEVRLQSATLFVKDPIGVRELIEEVEVEASLDAREREISLSVGPVAREIEIDGDRPILTAALMNLLQNAFKFTRAGGRVSLTTSANQDHVLFAVEDECGGLPAGEAEDLFQPYVQSGADRRGMGLGLTISRRAVEAHGGTLTARNLPGRGCIFTIALPRLDHGALCSVI
jgi:signal transduction histidine kinase